MKKELTLKEIQQGELQVAMVIDQICNDLGLRYFINYGTLLGAIRHHGFIPWDDDIDVVMPRKDYEVFVEYCRKNADILKPFELIHYTTEPNYIYPIARLSDSRYDLEFNNAKPYRIGLFVDIYPMDGCGNTKEEAISIRKKNKLVKTLVYAGSLKKYTKSNQGILYTLIKFMLMFIARMIGEIKMIRFLDNSAKKLEYDDCKYVGIICWEVSGEGYFDKNIFAEYEECEFDGYKFRIPKAYDRLLSDIYGDYMKLPPENERIAHHYYRAYKK